MNSRALTVLRRAPLTPSMHVVFGSAGATGWYRPPNQAFTGSCIKAALAAHSGKIERMHVNTTGPGVKVRIYIEQTDRKQQQTPQRPTVAYDGPTMFP